MTKYILFLLLIFSIGFFFANNVLVSITVEGNVVPSTPVLIAASNLTDTTSTDLEWLQSSDDENDSILYFIKVGTTSSGTNILDANTSDTNYNNITVATGNTYYWSVKACDNNLGNWENCSSWSTEDSFTVSITQNPGGGNGGSSTKKESCSIIGTACLSNETCVGIELFSFIAENCCLGQCVVATQTEETETNQQSQNPLDYSTSSIIDSDIISDNQTIIGAGSKQNTTKSTDGKIKVQPTELTNIFDNFDLGLTKKNWYFIFIPLIIVLIVYFAILLR